MAFIQVISMALCLAAASAAPQTLVHSSPALVHAAPTVFRSAPTFVSHAAPTVVRTAAVAQPVVHTIAHAAPATATVVRTAPAAVVVEEAEEEIDPSYNFGYSVADIESGDSKTREETRDGDYISGSYSVADPDGRVRLVEYTADPENGFQAKVTFDGADGPVAIPFDQPKEETVIAAAPAPAVIATRTAAPTFVRTAAPAEAVHAVHNVPATTFVRAAAPAVAIAHPAEAVHAVHNVAAPATTVVRTAAAPVVTHAAFPTATHLTHF